MGVVSNIPQIRQPKLLPFLVFPLPNSKKYPASSKRSKS